MVKKIKTLIFLSLFCFIVGSGLHAEASVFNNTKSFGGKILTVKIPPILCNGGQGPILLNSNIGGAVVSAAGTGYVSGMHTTQNGGQISSGAKAGLIAAGSLSTLYNLIPYYINPSTVGGDTASMGTSQAAPQKWILGKSDLIPNFNDCWIPTPTGKIPFPVLELKKYKVSQKPGF